MKAGTSWPAAVRQRPACEKHKPAGARQELGWGHSKRRRDGTE